ncbi:Uncharacterised protein [Mycobacterium tuberculosis]|nr:Uncharacterised protein [Mycobacterium tuberculosis]
MGGAWARCGRPGGDQAANPTQSSTGCGADSALRGHVYGAPRRGLARDRAGSPQLRSHSRLRRPVLVPQPTNRGPIRECRQRLRRCRGTSAAPRVADAGSRSGVADGVGFSARSRRDRAGHRVSLPGHGDLLRPTRAAAPMAVLAARTASVGDQSGAGLGCPAARCAHRADDHPRPGEAGKAEAGAVT